MYWKILPENKRNICLFRNSCSKAVHFEIKNNGIIKGFKLLIFRINNCNSDYCYFYENDEFKIKTKESVILKECEINPYVLNKLKNH